MKKNIIFQFVFVITLLDISTTICFSEVGSRAAKSNLIIRIKNDIQMINEELKKPYQSQILFPNSAEAIANEFTIKESFRLERKKIKNLLQFVKAQSAEKLPFVMVDHLVKGDFSYKEYPELGQYIMMLEESVLPAIDQVFDHVEPRMKCTLLDLLGTKNYPRAVAIIRRALNDDNKDVVLTGLRAWHQILGIKTTPEVEKTIFSSHDSLKIQENPETLYLTGDAEWYDALLSFSEKKKLSLYDISMLVNFSDFTETIIGRHIPFLLSLAQDKNKNNLFEVKLAAQLLAKLTQKDKLTQLTPLISAMIPLRFYQGGLVENYSDYPKSAANDSPFSHDDIVMLTERVINALTVEDLKILLDQNKSKLLTRLYLQDQINKKTNVLDEGNEKSFNFKIEVFNKAGSAISSTQYLLNLDQEQTVLVPAGQDGFPVHQVKLTCKLDHDKWMFYLNPIVVELKPSGAGFSAYVPFQGAYEIKLTEEIAGKREQFKWKFSHI